MELFIQIKDGVAFEHPILESNFRLAFPHIDTNNLPEGFSKFVRVEIPKIGVYENYLGSKYEKVGSVWMDGHRVEPMTDQQILEKQNAVKEAWVSHNGHASWVFNEVTCSFEAPVKCPNDGKKYYWDEQTTSWIEVINA